MVQWRVLLVAALSIAMCTAPSPQRSSRSVVPPSQGAIKAPSKFDPTKSTALLVGIRASKSGKDLPDVPYAVDDAINLAHTFSLDRKVALVPPQRIVLALAGVPEKPESRAQCHKLRAAGATIITSTKFEVLSALRQQAASAGGEGLLIVAFASHGFSTHGTPYVMAEDSVHPEPATAISVDEVLDIASAARRSLIFIDACRERLPGAARGRRDVRGAAPPIKKTHVEGQAVFYAAAAGGFAYDNHEKQNGVFTDAVLEGLRCEVARDARGTVTVETLAGFVEKHVLEWINRHRDPNVRAATQISMEGGTGRMPLASCPAPVSLVRVETNGASVTAFGDDGSELWRREVRAPIALAEAADLDGDGTNEVILAADTSIIVFDITGEQVWTADERMQVRTFVTGDVFRKKRRQVVALSVDERGSRSRLCIFDHEGTRLSTYLHPGLLQDVAIDQLTSHHPPRIIVTAVNQDLEPILKVRGSVGSVFMLDPKKVRSGSQLWYGAVLPPTQIIQRLEIIDHNNDGKRDICVTTSSGRIYLNFDGQVMKADGAQFVPIAAK